MKMPSVMGHTFSQVPSVQIPRSQFNRNHGNKFTFDAGFLVPVMVDEILPGDTFDCRMTAITRMLSPLQVPIMDNMFLESFFFFVPNRLIWNNWQHFCGELTDPGDLGTDYTVPFMTSTQPAVGSLADYFGLPTAGQAGGNYEFVSLPFRAYNLIYNEWFRDQNLIDSKVVDKDDGPDAIADYVLLRRGKRHDYFTSCLPWPQKGSAVSLPLGTQAPVSIDQGTGGVVGVLSTTAGQNRRLDPTAGNLLVDAATATDAQRMYADLSSATAATINQLRQAFAVQRLLERDARGGTRYTEIVKSHFGVTSPDARLQRPEYLGGGSSMIQVSEIQQNNQAVSGGSLETPPGSLFAQVKAGASGHGFVKSFTEHGYVIGLICVRADLTYQQGMDRMWFRRTREDFYWPALSHIGEQAVLSREIYTDSTTVDDDSVFGYQERYGEYRYKPSKIGGKLRSTAAGSLDIWHLSQDFATRPTLNQVFIEEDPPLDRVSAVTTEPHFVIDTYFALKCARPMPLFGVPGMIDHF